MNLHIIKADYATHGQDIIHLLSAYAQDPMGGGQDLSDDVKSRLIDELAKLPHAFSVLAYHDKQAVGLINCFEAFSTFSCQPLINIHDVIVDSAFRGQGISQKMLSKVEAIARQKNCCKLTLEILSNNQIARDAYRKFGFSGYELNPEHGEAVFWQKIL